MSYAKCVSRVREVLGRYGLGEGFWDDFLYRVFTSYFRFPGKTGGRRVVGFVKRGNPVRRGSFTLYAVLEDGQEVDWSYLKACRSLAGGAEAVLRENVYSAFRRAVDDQVLEFIRGHSFGTYVVVGGRLYRREEVDVHHVGKPFSTLVEEFLRSRGLRLEDVAVKDLGVGYDIADPVLREEWREFHRRNAKLTLVPGEKHRR